MSTNLSAATAGGGPPAKVPPIPAVRMTFANEKVTLWAERGWGQPVRVAVIDVPGLVPAPDRVYPTPHAALVAVAMQDAARLSVAELPPGGQA